MNTISVYPALHDSGIRNFIIQSVIGLIHADGSSVSRILEHVSDTPEGGVIEFRLDFSLDFLLTNYGVKSIEMEAKENYPQLLESIHTSVNSNMLGTRRISTSQYPVKGMMVALVCNIDEINIASEDLETYQYFRLGWSESFDEGKVQYLLLGTTNSTLSDSYRPFSYFWDNNKYTNGLTFFNKDTLISEVAASGSSSCKCPSTGSNFNSSFAAQSKW